ncbi:MAG: thiamine pyrophosphate-dependent enzyme [Candidatus Hydrogenedentes bacterium]|nr:thiamine pyrophosphate-dependent enzyme [Candidatus Hydrogenedentota bacterium]
MSSPVASPAAKAPKTNRIGLVQKDYQGAESTLCAGCGHDAITSSIIKAFYELGIQPHMVAKLSGIGCSSKTTNYFLNQSHGFNSVHGRMATIATGASIANRQLVNIGISGDGDTASIGLGHFCHMVRRNIKLVYVIENNGCYGLTKGQASATADQGTVMKSGITIQSQPVDLCALAVEMGCGFVARSFSGDTQQVRTLIKAAFAHNGTAVLDIVSPCVTFNNHEGSTKSQTYARDHEEPLHEMDFIPHYENIAVEYEPGTTKVVTMHDGSRVTLKKLAIDYGANDRTKAIELLGHAREHHTFYTGLIYHNPNIVPFNDHINIVEQPLAQLPDSRTRPSNEIFAKIMQSFA